MRFEGDNRKIICRWIIFLPRQLVEGNWRKEDNEKGASLLENNFQQRNLI